MDTLELARKLGAGDVFTREQAERLAEVIGPLLAPDPATQADVTNLGSELRQAMAETKAELRATASEVKQAVADAKADLIRLMLYQTGAVIGGVGVLIALLKALSPT